MTGGVGIAEEWTGDAEDPDHWRDTHVRVRGPVVRGLQGAFAEHWLEATGEVLAGEDYLPDLDPVERRRAGCSSSARRPASATPTSRRSTTSRSPRPQRRSTSPRPTSSRAPPSSTRSRRRPSAASSPRSWCPARTSTRNSCALAGRAAYEALLDAGVEIFEYQPTMLHAKTMVVDGAWSSVGTVNFDNRSFQLHDEVTLCVWDEHFAGLLTEAVRGATSSAPSEIDPGRWERRGARRARHRGGHEGCCAGALRHPARARVACRACLAATRARERVIRCWPRSETPIRRRCGR